MQIRCHPNISQPNNGANNNNNEKPLQIAACVQSAEVVAALLVR